MKTATILTPEARRTWLKDQTLKKDRFLELCLNGNIPCVTLILHIILNRTDLEVLEVTVQRTLPNMEGGHEARFDVFAGDAEGRLYDIEMQVGGLVDALTRRMRFYCSLLDISHLKPGEGYERLPETWVIFILDQDMFGLDHPLYRIERCVLGATDPEGKERLFGDGAHIVVVNGARREEETDLSRLLHDLDCPDPARMHFKVLADTVRYYKNTDKGGDAVDEFLKKLQDEGREIGREEGMAKGREETQRSFVFQLLADGVPLTKIAQYTLLSLEKVQALAAEAPSARS